MASDNEVATACMQVRIAGGKVMVAEMQAMYSTGCQEGVGDARRALEDAILAAAPLINARRAGEPVTA